MSELHQYVPSTERTTICSVSTEGEETQEEMLDVKCHRVLFAGDQLTVKRARSARAQRNNSPFFVRVRRMRVERVWGRD